MNKRDGMSATSWLWDELHDLFDVDDGSLPEIRVDYTDSAGRSTCERECLLLDEDSKF